MTWLHLSTIRIWDTWQFTPIVEGEFFRFTHLYLPANYRVIYAQGSTTEPPTLYDLRGQSATPGGEVFKFKKPPCWDARRIGIRKNVDDDFSWNVQIEVWLTESSMKNQNLTLAANTPTKILDANSSRDKFVIVSQTNGIVWIQKSETAQLLQGIPLLSTGSSYEANYQGEIWAISATENKIYIEEYF